jgi:hypothetical protein
MLNYSMDASVIHGIIIADLRISDHSDDESFTYKNKNKEERK